MLQTSERRAGGCPPGLTLATVTPDPESDFERLLDRIMHGVPPFIGLPKPKDRCPWTSKSRTGLLELIAPCERNGFKPPVQAIYKKAHKHARRGQWLIPTEALFRYLLGLSASSTEEYLATARLRSESREGRVHK